MGSLSSKKSIYFRSDYVRLFLPPRIDCDDHIFDTFIQCVDTLVQCEDTEGSLMGEVRLYTLDLVKALRLTLIAEVKEVVVVLLKHSAKLLIHCLALLSCHVPWFCVTHYVISEGKKGEKIERLSCFLSYI